MTEKFRITKTVTQTTHAKVLILQSLYTYECQQVKEIDALLVSHSACMPIA